jgi:two-component system, LytTR family, sensor kinase
MFKSKTSIVVVHVVGWLLFFSLVLGFVSTSPGHSNIFPKLFSPYYLEFYTICLFLFYFNSWFLIPKLYLGNRYTAYFTIILLLFVGMYFLRPFDHLLSRGSQPGDGFGFPGGPEEQNPPLVGKKPRVDIISMILFVMIWSLSTAMQIIKQWRDTEQRAAQAEVGKANAELSFLKAQINPHFLFNTLNNIYSLAITKNENTPVAIMKLSNIMRYVTDEVAHDFVPLENEVNSVTDYIDLQRMRLNEKIRIDFSVAGSLEGKRIPPLVLITFIENVFKYGISGHEPSTITIKLFSEENTISFFSQNKIFNTEGNVERPGIGIANTKQRLEQLYPNRHLLNIQSENGIYTIRLTLQV